MPTLAQVEERVRTALRDAGLPTSFAGHTDQMIDYVQTMNLVEPGEVRVGRVSDHAAEVVVRHLVLLARGQGRAQALAERPVGDARVLVLHGHREGAVLAAERAVAASGGPVPPGTFKRAHPRAWEMLAPFVGGARVSPATLAMVPSAEYHVETFVWREGNQVAEKNEVAVLGIADEELLDLAGDGAGRALSMMKQSSEQSGHPVAREASTVTAGWVRFGWDDRVLLVEEVQSDWLAAHSQWSRMPPAMRARAPVGSVEGMTHLLDVAAERFEHILEDALAAAIRIAADRSASRIEMLHHSTKVHVDRAAGAGGDAPRSAYTDVPRRAGFREGPHEFQGATWPPGVKRPPSGWVLAIG